ncbi:spore germination protein GerPB [Ornithinibacillus halotolerans]|uniref:Spore germination protein GerPB n=1 Tax=Ornithinibacillus halotolerans TaxID=1274357 RepID=A0A916RVZ6_9BACI|nr:spore germination protein GerPB [Ornithinibacillus halotolerans]GGA73769.1 putative spore germination protein GerPB [Ornithinibacillus halotolerans]
MNITVHQSIHINFLKIGSISNSSVLQIGSTGAIQAQSDLYNSGGFTEPAEEAEPQSQAQSYQLVPLRTYTTST